MAFVYVPYVGPIVKRADAQESGLYRYFTGSACKHGHIAERHTANRTCDACFRIRRDTPEYHAKDLAYRELHRDDAKVRASAHYAANRVEVNKRRAIPEHERKRVQRNLERELLRSIGLKVCRICLLTRPYIQFSKCSANWDGYQSKCVQCEREYRLTNRDSIKKNNENWSASHPDAWLSLNRNRRARRRMAVGKHSAADIAWLFTIQSGKCAHAWCRVSLKKKKHVDHIIPIALGGSNDRKNLQLLCAPCNQKKNSKHPILFAQMNGMLL